MIDMHANRIETVGPKRTTPAPFLPIRREHEVIDQELASSFEEIRQRLLPARSCKEIILADLNLGQFPALLTQPIPQPSEFFFLSQ